MIDRALARVGDDDPATRAAKLRAFELLVVIHLCAERWFYASGNWSPLLAQLPLNALATWALAILALSTSWRRAGFAGLALVQLSVVAYSFPRTGNHNYLILYILVVLALLGRDEADEKLVLGSVRWLLVVVLFYSGLQKLVHGYWLHGEFLAHAIQNRPTFRLVLGPLLPAEELARLVGRGPVGPYELRSPFSLLISNATYVTEMALALMLLVRRTRLVANGAAFVFLAITEAMARELFFGLLFVSTLLLFVPGDLNRRTVPVMFGLYTYLILIEYGALPRMTFH